ncbi:cytochrome c biogenesis protein ResB, partial [Micromonospora tulbaghiae]|uniref:cytochrome c biogenesis protein ResB n=1 Tax=Micromonospora tulbaghiae TaxID=479978 RepID=UPI003F4CDAEA
MPAVSPSCSLTAPYCRCTSYLAIGDAPGQTLLLVASGTLLLGLMGSLFARRRRVWF